MAAFSKDKWEEFNPSLRASTVLGSSDTQHRFCSACMSSDHNKQECALSSMDPNVSRTNALNAGPSLNCSNSPLLACPIRFAQNFITFQLVPGTTSASASTGVHVTPLQSSTTIFLIIASALDTVLLNAKGSQKPPLRQNHRIAHQQIKQRIVNWSFTSCHFLI